MNTLVNRQIDKSMVERQFSRAAESYDSASSLQQNMSNRLIDLMRPHIQTDSVQSITDLGCGTGQSLQQLSLTYLNAQTTGVDLSSSMLQKACNQDFSRSPVFICEDMEQYQAPEPQNIVFSNASIQWSDLVKVARNAHKALMPSGLFAFSTFGPSTHTELKNAWSKIDNRCHQIDFLSQPDHLLCLESMGFIALEERSEIHRIPFNSGDELLQSIKKVGATNASTNRNRGLLSRQRYRDFIAELEKANPLELTYEALYFVMQKNDRQGQD